MTAAYLLIYLLVLYLFFKTRNIKAYILLGLFPILVSFLEIYQNTLEFTEKTYITALLTLIWFLGFYIYSLKEKTIKSQLYWSMWSLFIYALTVMDLNFAIFWVSMCVGLFYLIFQSKHDDNTLSTWMLTCFAIDVLYIILSPEVFVTGNYLLVPAEGVIYLDTFLKFLVPTSLALKMIGLHKSYMDGRREESLCRVELVFLASLLLYKYSDGFLLNSSEWHMVSLIFCAAAACLWFKAFLGTRLTDKSVFSLLFLNFSIYICLVDLFDFRPSLLLIILGVFFLQRYLFGVQRLSLYSPFLSLVFVPALMFLAAQTQNHFFQTTLLLLALLHLRWVYAEKVTLGRSYAS